MRTTMIVVTMMEMREALKLKLSPRMRRKKIQRRWSLRTRVMKITPPSPGA
jgi:hypothetical protein